jgi:micrococcal nuclease
MRGDCASITIHGVPGTTASIEVIYKSGPSHASGLVRETVDTTGNVSWQWKVGTRTTPGNWPVYIQGVGKALAETLRVH